MFVNKSPRYEIHQMEMHLFNLIKTVNRCSSWVAHVWASILFYWRSASFMFTHSLSVHLASSLAHKKECLCRQRFFVTLKNIKIRCVNSLSILAVPWTGKKPAHRRVHHTLWFWTFHPMLASHKFHEWDQKKIAHKFEWHLSFIEYNLNPVKLANDKLICLSSTKSLASSQRCKLISICKEKARKSCGALHGTSPVWDRVQWRKIDRLIIILWIMKINHELSAAFIGLPWVFGLVCGPLIELSGLGRVTLNHVSYVNDRRKWFAATFGSKSTHRHSESAIAV